MNNNNQNDDLKRRRKKLIRAGLIGGAAAITISIVSCNSCTNCNGGYEYSDSDNSKDDSDSLDNSSNNAVTPSYPITSSNTSSNESSKLDDTSNDVNTSIPEEIDKSELDRIQEELNLAKATGDYTEESINEKQSLINIAYEKDLISEYKVALEEVKTKKLVPKIVDKSELDKIQKELNLAKASSEYTEESINEKQTLIDIAYEKNLISEYKIALEEVKAKKLVLKPKKPDDTSKPSDTSKPNDTSNPIDTSKPEVIDKSELDRMQEELNLAKASGDYTEKSISEKQTLIDIARGKNTLVEYNEALSIAKAKQLVPKAVNKFDLFILQAELNIAKNSGDYTEESINEKQNLIDIAQSKNLISEYNKALDNAKAKKLVAKPVDKSELDKIQRDLNYDKRSGDYTEESIAEKQTLIDIAYDKNLISEYKKALEKVKKYDLVLKPYEYEPDDDDSKDDTSSGDNTSSDDNSKDDTSSGDNTSSDDNSKDDTSSGDNTSSDDNSKDDTSSGDNYENGDNQGGFADGGWDDKKDDFNPSLDFDDEEDENSYDEGTNEHTTTFLNEPVNEMSTSEVLQELYIAREYLSSFQVVGKVYTK